MANRLHHPIDSSTAPKPSQTHQTRVNTARERSPTTPSNHTPSLKPAPVLRKTRASPRPKPRARRAFGLAQPCLSPSVLHRRMAASGNVVAGWSTVLLLPVGVSGNVVTMSSTMVEAWVCDYADCGHVWMVGECVPQRCSKCHRRGWNAGAQVEARRPPRVRQPAPEPQATPTAAPILPALTGGRQPHDPKTCRVYRCGACAKVGHHDAHRGLA